MWPDWVSNPGPLTYESGALPTALRGPAIFTVASLDNVPIHLYPLYTGRLFQCCMLDESICQLLLLFYFFKENPASKHRRP